MTFFNWTTTHAARAAIALTFVAGAALGTGCSAAAPTGESTAVEESALGIAGGTNDEPGITQPVITGPAPTCPILPPVQRGPGQCSLQTRREVGCINVDPAEAERLGCSAVHYYEYDDTAAEAAKTLVYQVCPDTRDVRAYATLHAKQGLALSATLIGNCVGRAACGQTYLTCDHLGWLDPLICSGACPLNTGLEVPSGRLDP